MALQKDVIAAGQEQASRLKSFLDDLEVQMALGKMEARDAFEREKKNLNQFIQDEKNALAKMDKEASSHRAGLWKAFEKLDSNLSRPFATTKRKFDTEKKATLASIYELEAALKEAYGDVRPTIQELLDKVKSKLDTYRVQLALGSIEDETALQDKKAELTEAITGLRERLQKDRESKGKLSSFVDEMGESFDHFKRAFSDLF